MDYESCREHQRALELLRSLAEILGHPGPAPRVIFLAIEMHLEKAIPDLLVCVQAPIRGGMRPGKNREGLQAFGSLSRVQQAASAASQREGFQGGGPPSAPGPTGPSACFLLGHLGMAGGAVTVPGLQAHHSWCVAAAARLDLQP